jgi:hypothetical protein
VGNKGGGIPPGKEFVVGFMFDSLKLDANVLLTEKLRRRDDAWRVSRTSDDP